MTVKQFVFAFLLVSISTAEAAEPLVQVCSPPAGKPAYQVHIVGGMADLVELWQGTTLLFADYTEMRASMGTRPKKRLSCDDVTLGNDVVGVRAGSDGDILHAYGLIRDPSGQIVKVQRAIIRLRDGEDIKIAIDPSQPSDLLINFGHQKDLRTRLCFGIRADLDHAAYGPTEWGRSHGNPRSAVYPPCQGRLDTGSTGNTDWGQNEFDAGASN
jgi:hypothetical protein